MREVTILIRLFSPVLLAVKTRLKGLSPVPESTTEAVTPGLSGCFVDKISQLGQRRIGAHCHIDSLTACPQLIGKCRVGCCHCGGGGSHPGRLK